MRGATILSGILAVAACSGTPSGPGSGGGGPTGSIYITWRIPDPEHDTDLQLYRISASDGRMEQVEIPYYSLNPWFDVDIDGSGVVFIPPLPAVAWMPGFDMGRLLEPIQNSRRVSPRISPDLNSIASIIVEQFIPRQIRILDMRTGVERVIGTMEDEGGWSINHWFAGGDSLLVSWYGHHGHPEYYIAQADGSGLTPFKFPFSRHAYALSISPDESKLAISTPLTSDSVRYATDTIQVYDIDPPRLVLSLGLPYYVGQIEWSPDGKYLAHIGGGPFRGDNDNYLKYPVLEIIDVETGERTPLLMNRPPGAFALYVDWAKR